MSYPNETPGFWRMILGTSWLPTPQEVSVIALKAIAGSGAGMVLISVLAGCGSEPTATDVQETTNRLLAAAKGGYDDLTPREQHLVCREFQGSLPDGQQINAGAARADIVMSPDMLRVGIQLKPELFPQAADLAVDEVLAQEC